MSLNSEEMRKLEAQSAALRSEAKTYVAEAMNAARTARDPRAAQRLMMILAKSARNDQRQAIGDVRRWIDGRLSEDPNITVERFMLELGWLRRMCVARDGARRRSS